MTPTENASVDTSTGRQSKSVRSKFAVYTCAVIILVLNIAFYSKGAPTPRLVELTICREYFESHDPSVIGPYGFIPERLCKASAIQKKLAWLFALNLILISAAASPLLEHNCPRLMLRIDKTYWPLYP